MNLDCSQIWPKVGVAVIAMNNGDVLVGRRIGSHGSGTWQFPGGHLELYESVEACATREMEEETGLPITNIRRGPYTNDVFRAEGKHYITIFVLAETGHRNVELREPEKCSEWRWCKWGGLPTPRFLPMRNLLESGFTPFEEAV